MRRTHAATFPSLYPYPYLFLYPVPDSGPARRRCGTAAEDEPGSETGNESAVVSAPVEEESTGIAAYASGTVGLDVAAAVDAGVGSAIAAQDWDSGHRKRDHTTFAAARAARRD